MTPARIVDVSATAADAGERLDRFLAARGAGVSRSRVKALIEAGHVTCDGAVLTDPASPVRAGPLYRVAEPPPVDATPAAEAIPLVILHEDDDLLVIDKPAGLVVHPAPGNETGTLVNAVLAHCGADLAGIGGERRPGIVHRLDRDTSGVMVVAKTEAALAALAADFAARRDLEREYLALVWGVPATAEGSVDAPIGRDPRDRKRMAVRGSGERGGGGKPALTHWRLRETWHGGASLLACRLATGRTHQIRVHLASVGHPVVGDPVYLRRIPAAARVIPEPARSTLLDFPRQALHAARLGFRHPRDGRPLVFLSQPPEDFRALLLTLGTRAPSAGAFS